MKIRHIWIYVLLFVSVFEQHAYASGAVSLNWSDLFPRVINFLILFGIIFWFARKPLANGFKSVIQGRVNEYTQAVQAEKKAKEELKNFESRMADLNAELETYKGDILKDIEAEKVQIIRSAEIGAENIKRQTDAIIEGRVRTVSRELVRDVIDKAAAQLVTDIEKKTVSIDYKSVNDKFISGVRQN